MATVSTFSKFFLFATTKTGVVPNQDNTAQLLVTEFNKYLYI